MSIFTFISYSYGKWIWYIIWVSYNINSSFYSPTLHINKETSNVNHERESIIGFQSLNRLAKRMSSKLLIHQI